MTEALDQRLVGLPENLAHIAISPVVTEALLNENPQAQEYADNRLLLSLAGGETIHGLAKRTTWGVTTIVNRLKGCWDSLGTTSTPQTLYVLAHNGLLSLEDAGLPPITSAERSRSAVNNSFLIGLGALGLSSAAIGDLIGKTDVAVRAAQSNVYRGLKVANMSAAVTRMFQLGLWGVATPTVHPSPAPRVMPARLAS